MSYTTKSKRVKFDDNLSYFPDIPGWLFSQREALLILFRAGSLSFQFRASTEWIEDFLDIERILNKFSNYVICAYYISTYTSIYISRYLLHVFEIFILFYIIKLILIMKMTIHLQNKEYIY